jgi:hypothetical protein
MAFLQATSDVGSVEEEKGRDAFCKAVCSLILDLSFQVSAAVERPITPKFIAAFGNLFEAAATDPKAPADFNDLTFGRRDAASLAGQLTYRSDVLFALSRSGFHDLANRLEDPALDASKKGLATSLALPGLGSLLCGMSPGNAEVALKYEDTARLVLAAFGRLTDCGESFEQKSNLRRMAVKVRKSLGDVHLQ